MRRLRLRSHRLLGQDDLYLLSLPDERIIANVLIHTGSMRMTSNSDTAAVHSSASAKKVKLS